MKKSDINGFNGFEFGVAIIVGLTLLLSITEAMMGITINGLILLKGLSLLLSIGIVTIKIEKRLGPFRDFPVFK